IYGICAATGDYYTTALTAEEYARMKESMGDDNYGGVGIYIEADRKNNNRLTVIEPIEGGPAERAGIKAADYIYEIDGKPTDSIDLENCSQMMRGPKGTAVTLGIKRGNAILTFKLIRDDIHVKSTQLKELGNGIAYIRVRFFGPETGKEFKIKRMEAEARGAKCLILDLRNNGGGYVITAGEMVSAFLPKGSLITNLVNPHVGTDEDFRVNVSDNSKIPLVVLINRFSASASELAAGCLQDHKRAVIVGETSFGKGSVQRIFDLPNGGALKFTIAHYLTPNHKDIHMKGITPDIVCEDEPTNKLGGPDDKQLEAAIKAVPQAEKLQEEYLASSSPAP
nr:S41 family peptidase [bacterium]